MASEGKTYSRNSSFSDISEDEPIIDPMESILPFCNLSIDIENKKITLPHSLQTHVIDEKDSMVIAIDEGPVKVDFPSLEEMGLCFKQNYKVEVLPDFSLKDPLFDLRGPVGEIRGEDEPPCPQCVKPLSKKNKKCCKFCGRAHYGDCIKETRAFPGSQKRYPICDTCSLKFFLRQLYEEYDMKIKEKENIIAKMKNEFNRVRKESMEVKATYDDHKARFKTEKKRQQQALKEIDIKISNIKREQRQIAEEQERLTSEINESHKVVRETTEKHEELEEKFTKISVEYKKLTAERDAVKRDCKMLEGEITELQDLISVARKKQPRQGRKRVGGGNSGLLEPVLTQAAVKEDMEGLKRSIVDPPGCKCCVIL